MSESMAFKMDEKTVGSSLHLTFSGALDEEVTLKKISLQNCNDVAIDLGLVDLINSCGVREWIQWISTAPNTTKFRFICVPRVFVTQMNSVMKFIPELSRVDSVQVPFVCEPCGIFKSVLFQNGIEYSGSSLNQIAEVKCENCQAPMEMDVVPAKYFHFLKYAKL